MPSVHSCFLAVKCSCIWDQPSCASVSNHCNEEKKEKVVGATLGTASSVRGQTEPAIDRNVTMLNSVSHLGHVPPVLDKRLFEKSFIAPEAGNIISRTTSPSSKHSIRGSECRAAKGSGPCLRSVLGERRILSAPRSGHASFFKQVLRPEMLLQEVALGLKALLDHPNTKGYLIWRRRAHNPYGPEFRVGSAVEGSDEKAPGLVSCGTSTRLICQCRWM